METVTIQNQHWVAQINRINSDRDWFGTLTTWNAEAVANRLRRMLEGKRYTFVAVNNGMCDDKPPEVRTGQMLNGSKSHKPAGDGSHVSFSMLSSDHAHILVCDTYGVWGLSSTSDLEGAPNYEQPYVTFKEWRGKQFTVVHRAPAGHLLRWVAAVEDGE